MSRGRGSVGKPPGPVSDLVLLTYVGATGRDDDVFAESVSRRTYPMELSPFEVSYACLGM